MSDGHDQHPPPGGPPFAPPGGTDTGGYPPPPPAHGAGPGPAGTPPPDGSGSWQGTPPAGAPPAGAPPAWGTPTTPEPTKRRRWPIVVLVMLLVLGGCGTVATVVGFRFFGSLTAPIDVANEFLDAARSGGDAASHVCGGQYQPRDDLASSQGQDLKSVNISNNRVATVDGTLTLGDGTVTTIVLRLNRAGDDWCVADLGF